MTISRRSLWLSFAAVLVILIAAAIVIRKRGQAPDPYREIQIVRGDLEISILATGEVKPENRLEIKPPVAGRVEKILVKEGQSVSAGEVIGWMSSAERTALIDAARAKGPEEVKHWEDLYRPTPIMAPLNGTIIYRNVETGQTFGAGDTILIMSDRLLVKAKVDETDLAQIKNRQRARLILDAYPNEPMNGVVHKISYESTITNNVTTYVVDVLPEKIPATMRSGMTANVVFLIDSRKNVLLAPTEALKFNDDEMTEATVLVKVSEGMPQTLIVKTGLTDGKNTEILSGLSEGDTVLAPKLPSGSGKDGTNPIFGGARPRGIRR
jgi:macrolide-specific efflux system membrane fusion protein